MTTIPEIQPKIPLTTSLEFLLSQKEPLHSSKIYKKSTNAKLLERLADRLLVHVAEHDFSHPDLYEYIVEDYTAYLEYFTEEQLLKGRNTFLSSYQAFVDANPHYSVELESVIADVNEKNGTAAVWMLINVTGHPAGVRRQSVTMQQFKRKGGKWRAYKQSGIRGMAGYL